MTLDPADTVTTVIVPTGGGRTTPSPRPASRQRLARAPMIMRGKDDAGSNARAGRISR
jgi:hypothetical protein